MDSLLKTCSLILTGCVLLQGCIQTVTNADGSTSILAGPAAQRQNATVAAPLADHAKRASTSQVAGTSHKAPDEVDWTPMFKAMEKGCDLTPAWKALRDEISKTKQPQESSKTRYISTFNIKKVALPYRNAVNTQVDPKFTDGALMFTLGVQKGSYYGLPVRQIFSYSGLENGIGGYGLVLDVTPDVAKKHLSAVSYRASGSESCANSKLEIQPTRVNRKPMSLLVCDHSC